MVYNHFVTVQWIFRMENILEQSPMYSVTITNQLQEVACEASPLPKNHLAMEMPDMLLIKVDWSNAEEKEDQEQLGYGYYKPMQKEMVFAPQLFW